MADSKKPTMRHARRIAHNRRYNAWLSREPGLLQLLYETKSLLRRAVSRPIMTLSFTLVVALVAGVVLWLIPDLHAPRFVLRVHETDRGDDFVPRPKRKLRDYVEGAVFTHSRLLTVIEQHGLYRGLMRSDPPAAVRSFKEDIDVDVYRNYFVESRWQHQGPRSARIAVSYKSEDPQQSLQVARTLGRLIVRHENEARTHAARRALAVADERLKRARERVARDRNLLSTTRYQWQTAPLEERAVKAVKLNLLRRQLTESERQASDAERFRANLSLGMLLEQHQMGLHFEVADAGSIDTTSEESSQRLLGLTLLTWAGAAPWVVLLIGAFDSRVRTLTDIERAGAAPLGSVSSFPKGLTT